MNSLTVFLFYKNKLKCSMKVNIFELPKSDYVILDTHESGHIFAM